MVDEEYKEIYLKGMNDGINLILNILKEKMPEFFDDIQYGVNARLVKTNEYSNN